MVAPISPSITSRSQTCGSEAALWITVWPGCAAASMATSAVAVTLACMSTISRRSQGVKCSSSEPPLIVTPQPRSRRAVRWVCRRLTG